MKNLILTMALLLSVTVIAQHGERDHQQRRVRVAHDITAEQLAMLKTKKMALALELTSKQQEEVLKINLEQTTFRKAKMAERKENKEKGEHYKLTADERFELQNAILERKIAEQEKLKEILTDEQFNLWKKARNRKGMHGKKKMRKADRRG